jgi:hypothetical protein
MNDDRPRQLETAYTHVRKAQVHLDRYGQASDIEGLLVEVEARMSTLMRTR